MSERFDDSVSGFKPMLAHSKSPDPESLRYPVLVQPKLDGIRAVVKDGRLLSRTLKPIPNRSIREALERPEYEGLDGELIVGIPTDNECYRRTCSFVMAEDKTGEPWTFYVFDVHNGPGTNGERAKVLEADEHLWPDELERVATVAVTNARDLAVVEGLFVAEGFEGCIVRDPNARYKYGRGGKTGPLLKLKRYIDYEALVVGAYEEMHNGNPATTNALGRTERSSHKDGKSGKGALGALEVEALNGPHAGTRFKVGTGFTMQHREAIWRELIEDPAALEGRVAKVKSFPVGTKDKPRHPVWLGWRDMAVDG